MQSKRGDCDRELLNDKLWIIVVIMWELLMIAKEIVTDILLLLLIFVTVRIYVQVQVRLFKKTFL